MKDWEFGTILRRSLTGETVMFVRWDPDRDKMLGSTKPAWFLGLRAQSGNWGGRAFGDQPVGTLGSYSVHQFTRIEE